MPTVSTSACQNFNASLGDEVSFSGITGSCSITSITGQTWPFQNSSPINFPLPSNTKVKILAGGLAVGSTYSFSVSCCSSDAATKSVTIVAKK